jgi:filamentous hemagglutinin family protein
VNKALSPLFHLSLCTLGCLYASSTQAQVTPDDTVNTQVTPNVNVAEITEGETRGGNLFHSFQEFSVGTGNEAFFNNATDISNIFSRVTGGKISSIDGLVRANGSANLFLINPAGIVFGENASLNIGGSFYGSTASSILFEDGEFSATDLENPPVLTINAPIGLGFRDNPTPIENNSKANAGLDPAGIDGYFGLRVPEGKTFALAGGGITADGSGIVSFGGRIEIAAVGEEGTLGLTSNGDDFGFSFPDNLPRADVTLTNQAGFLVAAGGGGDIVITAKNIDILKESGLYAGILSNLGSIDTQAGDITLNATESVVLDNSSYVVNNVFLDGIGNSGNVNITTGSLSATKSSQINSFTDGQGNAGNVNITARDTISFDGRDENDSSASGIFTSVGSEANGKGGDINIDTGSLSVANRAQLSSNTSGLGNAGNILIKARDQVSLVNSILISEVTAPDENGEGGRGDAGDINITTSSLLLQDGSALLADTENQGNAGNIFIKARDQIVLEGEGPGAQSGSLEENFIVSSQITATVDGETNPDVMGNAGDININTRSLSISDEGFIRASTSGSGNAGDLNIGSKESPVKNLSLVNDAIISASTFSTGNAGNLTIFAESLVLESGAELQAISFDDGNAGNLTINALESVKISGTAPDGQSPSGIFASAFDGMGNGGNLSIATDELIVQDQGTITAGNFQIVFGERTRRPPGSGVPGNLNIEANSITLNNGARIDAATQSAQSEIGKSGVINLQVAEDITLQGNSFISARAFNNADGGNLNIDARFIVAYPSNGAGSDLVATAEQGQGGDINLNTEQIFGLETGEAINDETGNFIKNNNNDLDASSDVLGLDGTVNINSSRIDPLQGATELPSNVVESEQITTQQACQANRESNTTSGLNIKGKDGVTPAPDLPLNSQNIIGDETNSAYNIPEPIETSQGKIQPARGIKVTKDGRIILTAYRTNSAGERIPEVKPNCSNALTNLD